MIGTLYLRLDEKQQLLWISSLALSELIGSICLCPLELHEQILFSTKVLVKFMKDTIALKFPWRKTLSSINKSEIEIFFANPITSRVYFPSFFHLINCLNSPKSHGTILSVHTWLQSVLCGKIFVILLPQILDF
jgi:hypothetical protein